jgi:hypothetical protein
MFCVKDLGRKRTEGNGKIVLAAFQLIKTFDFTLCVKKREN